MTADTLNEYRTRTKLLIQDLEHDGVPAHSDVQHYLLAALMALDRMWKKAATGTPQNVPEVSEAGEGASGQATGTLASARAMPRRGGDR